MNRSHNEIHVIYSTNNSKYDTAKLYVQTKSDLSEQLYFC